MGQLVLPARATVLNMKKRANVVKIRLFFINTFSFLVVCNGICIPIVQLGKRCEKCLVKI